MKKVANGKMKTSAAMAQMRSIAYNPSTARKVINRLDKLHDDDAYEAAAQAKRDRKAAKRAALAALTRGAQECEEADAGSTSR